MMAVDQSLERLRLQAGNWGIRLDDSQLVLLGKYAALCANYELANVIGTRDVDQIILEHLADSLSCYLIDELRACSSIADVGAGAGLPGIPVGIVRPPLAVKLIEAVGKKARFMENVRAELNLSNIEVIQTRVEDMAGRPGYREEFDAVVARALATLPTVVEYCAPLVRVGGVVVAMKGALSQRELTTGLAASEELGLELREVLEVSYREDLPQKERRLVVFDKVRATPGRFPRKAGVAKKRPLGLQEKAKP